MSDNWVVQNLQNALDTLSEKLSEGEVKGLGTQLFQGPHALIQMVRPFAHKNVKALAISTLTEIF